MAESIVQYYEERRNEFETDKPHDQFIRKFVRIVPRCKTNKTVVGIDVGACVGNYLKYVKGVCPEPNARILCFEPNPVNVPAIQQKIESDDAVTLYEVALSNETTTANFYNWRGRQANHAGNVLGGLRGNGALICSTDVKRLDDVLDAHFKDQEIVIKFLKVDVEGNDGNVLKGCERYLDRTEYIVFECSNCLDDCRGPGIAAPMKDIVDFLSNHGFDTYRIGTKKLFKVNDECWNQKYEDLKFWSNCFALKKTNTVINRIIDADYNYRI